MQLNASRIKVLQAQDDLVNSMKEEASKELLRVSGDHHHYKKLLKELVVQVSTIKFDTICLVLHIISYLMPQDGVYFSFASTYIDLLV